MDIKRVNGAVAISMTLWKLPPKSKRYEPLLKDLKRLQDAMTQEEFNEYIKRTS